ncbi:MAG: S-ribosylhomocysteine lyase [Eubacteriales bacterium]
MDRIASFSIDHTRLLPGIYVSRKDKYKDVVITTFDIRMTRPNFEPVMDTAVMHALEHLGATFLRNHKTYKDSIVYFGPMGCRTGCYLLMEGDLSSDKIAPLIREMFEFIAEFEGEIPGAAPEECGNYLDSNLDMAKYAARKYVLDVLNNLSEDNLNYPK